MVRETIPEDLKEHEASLWRMLSDSMVRYLNDFGHVRATTSTKRGERNNINDVMRSVSKTMFPYIEEGNSFFIKLGLNLIRPKKFNERLETANYPTQASLAFDRQETPTQAWFEGFEPINLNVGYVPDPIDLRNSSYWLTRPGDGGWVYQLKSATATAVVTPMPVTDPNQGEKKSRVKPKRLKKVKTHDEDEKA